MASQSIIGATDNLRCPAPGEGVCACMGIANAFRTAAYSRGWAADQAFRARRPRPGRVAAMKAT